VVLSLTRGSQKPPCLPGKPQRSRRRSNRELYSAAPSGFNVVEGELGGSGDGL
jgi:hypothetical protein